MKWCRLELKKKTDSFLPTCPAPQPLFLTLTRSFLRKFRASSNKPQPSNLHHRHRDWDWDTGTTTTTPIHSHGLTSHSFFLELSVCHCHVCSAALSPPSVALRSFLSSSGRRAPSLQPLSSFTNSSFYIWSSSPQPRFCRRPSSCTSPGRLCPLRSTALPHTLPRLLRSKAAQQKVIQREEETMIFTIEQRQRERTGKYGSPRFQYLQELVTQFQNTTDEGILFFLLFLKKQKRILANLANFAYDPYNYNFLRQLNVLELFLDCMTEPNEKLVEFGVGGICNCCAVRNTVNYALGALYYVCNEFNKEEILKPEVIDTIKRYAAAEEVSASFSNLAKAFLDKHLSEN
ncbi:hypothetical protein AHAS_Ahas07G0036300 [Arachis hypogaea]